MGKNKQAKMFQKILGWKVHGFEQPVECHPPEGVLENSEKK